MRGGTREYCTERLCPFRTQSCGVWAIGIHHEWQSIIPAVSVERQPGRWQVIKKEKAATTSVESVLFLPQSYKDWYFPFWKNHSTISTLSSPKIAIKRRRHFSSPYNGFVLSFFRMPSFLATCSLNRPCGRCIPSGCLNFCNLNGWRFKRWKRMTIRKIFSCKKRSQW